MKKRISKKQAEANRDNARRSIGPKTADRKYNSKWNALKHGLSAKTVVLPAHCSDESPEEYMSLLSQLQEDARPVGFLEQSSVKRMADLQWRLRRAQKVEVGVISKNLTRLNNQEKEELASTTCEFGSF